MISSLHLLSDKSSGLSRSFITWQLHTRNLCSLSRKENWLVHLLSPSFFWIEKLVHLQLSLHGCIVIICIYFYSYVMRFWSQIVAFYFLQFINVWISVMMVLFHYTECGNKGNKLMSWLLLLLLLFNLFYSDCIGLAYEAVTWWTNDTKNLKARQMN